MSLKIEAATLYDFPFSSSSFRLRIAMNIKGVAPARTEPVNLRTGDHLTPDYLRVVGAPVVPAVDFGEAAFTQSIAIIEWLDTVYPGPRLIPEDPKDALIVRSMALAIACDIHPLNVPRVLKRLTREMGLSDEVRQDWYSHWVREGLRVLEHQLEAQAHRGDFCLGSAPTLADICLVPQVLNARRFNVETEDFKRIGDIYDRCMSEDTFSKAAPKPD
ncbi:MAG: maleylacetoacetate isomerase [Pseudomonadota bacterium]